MSSHGTAISKISSEAYGQLGYVRGVFSIPGETKAWFPHCMIGGSVHCFFGVLSVPRVLPAPGTGSLHIGTLGLEFMRVALGIFLLWIMWTTVSQYKGTCVSGNTYPDFFFMFFFLDQFPVFQKRMLEIPDLEHPPNCRTDDGRGIIHPDDSVYYLPDR